MLPFSFVFQCCPADTCAVNKWLNGIHRFSVYIAGLCGMKGNKKRVKALHRIQLVQHKSNEQQTIRKYA